MSGPDEKRPPAEVWHGMPPERADDPDARAFSPLARGLEALIEAEDAGLIKPPVLHFAPHGSYAPACGERVGFVRDHRFSVTCEACKPIAEAHEAKRVAKLAKAKARRTRKRGAA